jgi:hypothetical protein
MKTPREPRVLVLNEKAHSNTTVSGIFRKRYTTDYETLEGPIVSEVIVTGRPAEYRIKDTGELIQAKFYSEFMARERFKYMNPEEFE